MPQTGVEPRTSPPVPQVPPPVLVRSEPLPNAASFDPARLAVARDLVNVMLPPDQRAAIFETALNATMRNMVAGIMRAQGLDAMLAENGNAKQVFAKFVERQRKLALDDLTASTPELMLAYANAYARRFDVTELTALKAFFQTDLGAKYAKASREILSDPDIAAWQQGVAERGQRRLPGELARLKEDITTAVQDDAKGKKHDS
jgi:hypothetical protein